MAMDELEVKRNSATKQQLANDYEVSVPTLNKWLQKAGIATGRGELLYPMQLRQFYEVIGVPMVVKEKVA